MKNENKITALDLPDEVWINHIFTHFSVRELAIMRGVNHYFSDTVLAALGEMKKNFKTLEQYPHCEKDINFIEIKLRKQLSMIYARFNAIMKKYQDSQDAHSKRESICCSKNNENIKKIQSALFYSCDESERKLGKNLFIAKMAMLILAVGLITPGVLYEKTPLTAIGSLSGAIFLILSVAQCCIARVPSTYEDRTNSNEVFKPRKISSYELKQKLKLIKGKLEDILSPYSVPELKSIKPDKIKSRITEHYDESNELSRVRVFREYKEYPKSKTQVSRNVIIDISDNSAEPDESSYLLRGASKYGWY